MSSTLSICTVTGSRADYSYLYTPMKLIAASDALQLQLVATGSHLSSEHGNTAQLIEEDGFAIDAKVPMLGEGNDVVAVTQSMGRAVIGFADEFAQLRPDMVLVLGDRFEILAAVQAALIANIPVAHIGGGDVTEGAFDDAIRHSITKMSHLHFVTNELSKQRVLQMGENPEHVHLTGSPAIDLIQSMTFGDKSTFLTEVGLPPTYKHYALVTYHPETLSGNDVNADISTLTGVLETLTDTGLIITGANADTGGEAINAQLQHFADGHDNAVFHMSLGKGRFYHALHHCDVFIGNSSSALYEAPSFKLPVVNIGNRQGGRLCAENVVHCDLGHEAILSAIAQAMQLDCSQVISPYGGGDASQKILNVLENISTPEALLKKVFFSYDCS